MHTFVIVVAKRGRGLSRDLAHRLGEGRPNLTFEPTDDRSWTNPTGTVVLRSWERPNPAMGISSHWHLAPDGVTTFVGHVWPRPGGWPGRGPWAAQLAARCATGTVRDHAEGLAGVYSMVTLDADGRGWALSDPLGLRTLYVGETDDYTVCSSRADAAAWALDPTAARPAVDPLGTAWLPYVGYMVGDRTGFEGVRTLAQGSYLDVRPDDGARVRSWSSAPWIGDETEAAPHELVAAVQREIADHLRVVVALPAPVKVCGLTGGKDSRLLLSVLLSEGLAHQVRYLSLGDETVDDVAVARRLAERYGLDHRWGRHQVIPTSPYADRARTFVRRSGGVRNLWDQDGEMTAPDEINISGFCGEMLRTNYPLMTGLRSTEALVARFDTGLHYGTPGFARDDVWPTLHAEALHALLDDRGHPSTPLDLIDLFYVGHRMRRWFATVVELEQSNRVVPLYSLTALRAAFALGGQRRREEVLHRSVMRAAWPELVDEPFAGSGWADEAAPIGIASLPTPLYRLGGTGPGRRIRTAVTRWRQRTASPRTATPAAPPPATSASASASPAPATPSAPSEPRPVTANQAFQQRTLGERRPLLEQALGGDPGQRAFEVIDRDRVLDALRRLDTLEIQERKELFGAATAALWLDGASTAAGPDEGAEPGVEAPDVDPARAVP